MLDEYHKEDSTLIFYLGFDNLVRPIADGHWEYVNKLRKYPRRSMDLPDWAKDYRLVNCVKWLTKQIEDMEPNWWVERAEIGQNYTSRNGLINVKVAFNGLLSQVKHIQAGTKTADLVLERARQLFRWKKHRDNLNR